MSYGPANRIVYLTVNRINHGYFVTSPLAAPSHPTEAALLYVIDSNGSEGRELTKPSDFSPHNALEVDSQRQINRHVWMLRVTGAILLVIGWAAVSLLHPNTTELAVNTAVFVALGSYGFLAAAQSRRAATNMERKLRLGLLVHNMELENMAMRDELTQLFNRRYFFERLERELETARGFQRPLAVMVMDIDGMREINAVYGYRTGDDVLAAFGGFVLGCIRGSDVPARIGGDEFAIILPDTPEGAACMLMDRLMQRLAQADLMQDYDISLKISASFGVSGYPWGGQTVDAIVQAAQASAKANHRARHEQTGFPKETPAEGAIPSIFLKDADPD